MKHKVLNTLKTHSMLKNGDRVIVALSGGGDSVTLFSVLLSLKEELNIEVYAAHVNHNLRGQESLRDEVFVRNLCEENSVELFVKSVDVNSICKETNESFETVGRRVRYDFFKELSEKLDAEVATAHTLSDSLETALFNMARGATFSGLSSIPYKRGRIIRPLLDVTREEVESYAKENKLSYVDDSTNADADICNRNKIRHKAVPVLKEVNEGAEQNFLRLRQSLMDAESFINAEAEKLILSAKLEFGYDAKLLLAAHPAPLSYAIKLILEEKNAGFEHKHIELIKSCLEKSGAVPLINGCTAVVKQGVLRILNEKEAEKGDFPFKINSSFLYNGNVYSIKELSEEEIINKKLALKVIGYDKISSGANFRTRQGGDKIPLIKRNISKDLRKLQNELKIPSEQRDKMLLLQSKGKILWAEGVGVSRDGIYREGKGIFIEVEKENEYA